MEAPSARVLGAIPHRCRGLKAALRPLRRHLTDRKRSLNRNRKLIQRSNLEICGWDSKVGLGSADFMVLIGVALEVSESSQSIILIYQHGDAMSALKGGQS